MKRTSNGNIIYAQTNDYCAIWTMNFLETVSKMSSNGWTLVEQIDDWNSVMLCFAKWELKDLLLNLK
jgi:hypothetical protein